MAKWERWRRKLLCRLGHDGWDRLTVDPLHDNGRWVGEVWTLESRWSPRGLRALLTIRAHPFTDEPWDITDIGWNADYADPADIIKPIFGEVGPAPILTSSVNLGRFADPRFQRRMHAIDRLSGARRYRAYARLDADLARQAAPIAAYATETTDYFFSARIGCQTMQPVYGLDLGALCVRP